MTGVSKMTIVVTRLAYQFPMTFTLNPFHLPYENCTAFMWDVWTEKVITLGDESTHIASFLIEQLGEAVANNNCNLPPSFCGAVRNPATKRQSQYKIYEWMALAHWYIVPIGIELNFDSRIIENFSKFVRILEFSMTIKPRSHEEIAKLHSDICDFLTNFETIYVHDDPEKVSRMRLCIFQLIHIPSHIEWYGSIKLGSQATVERTIGELGHQICSKKAPFANLASLIYECQLMQLLCLYYPNLDPFKNSPVKIKPPLFSEFYVTKKSYLPGSSFYDHIQAISEALTISLDSSSGIKQWGKFRLSNGPVLNSKKFECRLGTNPPRSKRYFEAHSSQKGIFFGEALAFYSATPLSEPIIIYHELNHVVHSLGTLKGDWSTELHVAPISQIQAIVGIWKCEDGVYILRKHPGLEWLSAEERDLALEESSEGD